MGSYNLSRWVTQDRALLRPPECAPWELRKDGAADPQVEAHEGFPALLDALSDTVSE
jgi:hypothetical protein